MAQHGQSELHQEELQTVAGRQEHAGYCQKGMKKPDGCTCFFLFKPYLKKKKGVQPSMQTLAQR